MSGDTKRWQTLAGADNGYSIGYSWKTDAEGDAK